MTARAFDYETRRLQEIDRRVAHTRSLVEGLRPVWTQVDQKIKALEAELKALELEREKVAQGQLDFGFGRRRW